MDSKLLWVFTTDEEIQTPTILIAGEVPDSGPTDGGGGTSWTATYNVEEVADSLVDGPATVSVTYQDPAGNAGTTSPDTTVDNAGVTFDFGPPSINGDLNLVSGGINSALAIDGDVLL